MPYSYHISFLTIPPHLQINRFHNTTRTPKCTLRSVLLCLCLCVFLFRLVVMLIGASENVTVGLIFDLRGRMLLNGPVADILFNFSFVFLLLEQLDDLEDMVRESFSKIPNK